MSQRKLVLGADPGTMDGTGFVLWAYHPNELGLWEVYSEKRSANVKQVRSIVHSYSTGGWVYVKLVSQPWHPVKWIEVVWDYNQ